MCIYTPPQENYNPNDKIKFCDCYEIINSNTVYTIDSLDKEGYCIFHSNNIKWKRENNFYNLLFTLVEIFHNRNESADLQGFHFISERDDTDITYLSQLFPCNIRDSSFWKEVVVCDTQFDQEINLEFCTFKFDVKFEKCTFSLGAKFSDIDFYTEYSGKFILQESIFKGKVNFSDNKIKGSLYLNSCHFFEEFLFNNIQLLQGGILNVHSKFEKYTVFSNLKAELTTADFSNTYFLGETIFSNIKLQAEQQIKFSDLTIKNRYFFQAKEQIEFFMVILNSIWIYPKLMGKSRFKI